MVKYTKEQKQEIQEICEELTKELGIPVKFVEGKELKKMLKNEFGYSDKAIKEMTNE